MDRIDKTIIEELQKDADRKFHQIEKATRIPRSTIHNRVKKLKKEGVIEKLKAIVDPEKLGLNVCVLVHTVVSNRKGVHAIAERLSRQKNVQEVYITAGVFDIIVKVRFRSNKELAEFIFNDETGLKKWPGVERTESMICLESIKENGILEPEQA